MRQVLLALALLALTSCEESKDFYYQPMTGVGANFLVSDVTRTESGVTLVRFKFEFNNNSKVSVNFDVNKIEMLVNGKKPTEIHYNSLASNLYPNFNLPEGYSEHDLDVYLDKEEIGEDGIVEFVMVNTGLRENG